MTELVKRYYKNGNLREEYTLVNGVVDGVYRGWYENGQKYVEYTFVSGKVHGSHQMWYDNGRISNESNYVAGKCEVLYRAWYTNGQKFIEYTLVRNNFHGWSYKWNSDGSIKQVTLFRDGREVDFDVLAKEQLNIIMEELMATIYHPDRLERIAKRYNMDAMDYLEYLN